MQLNKPRSVRGALAVATCTLLANSPNAKAGADGDWKMDTALLTYAEKDRVLIVEPVLLARRALGEEEFLNLKAVFDTMTGASPNGASPTTTAQTFTGASGGTTYTVPADTTPTRDFSDKRLAASLDWENPISRTFRSVLGANISRESDYFSTGVSANFSKDVNDKLTTLSAGLSGGLDFVLPQGGAPQALAVLPAPATVQAIVGEEEFEREDNLLDGERKLIADGMVGITQVLNRRTLTQLNYTYGRSGGYLTDPYKILSVVNGVTGVTEQYRFERRPSVRDRQAVFWKLVHQFGEDVVNLSYRYYWDDWNIQSHTADLKYRFELGPGHYLQPHVRYYTQTSASFYRHSLVAGEPLPTYASADYRLAQMQSYTVGLKYARQMGKNGEWSVRAEYMKQSGNSHPADAIGLQKDLNLYPDLDVVIAQVSYSLNF